MLAFIFTSRSILCRGRFLLWFDLSSLGSQIKTNLLKHLPQLRLNHLHIVKNSRNHTVMDGFSPCSIFVATIKRGYDLIQYFTVYFTSNSQTAIPTFVQRCYFPNVMGDLLQVFRLIILRQARCLPVPAAPCCGTYGIPHPGNKSHSASG